MLVGDQVRELERLCNDEATVMAIIRGRRRILAPSGQEVLEAEDILILEGHAEALKPLFESSGLVHVGAVLRIVGLDSGQLRDRGTS